MAFLGIDIGTGGSRAVVIDERGAVVVTASADHAPFASPEIGWAEQDPHDWWRAVCVAVRSVLSSGAVGADEIAGIGLSGQMHGSVLLGEADNVLRPALLWCDQRTGAQCRQIDTLLGPERVVELVSNPAVTGFTLPKLLWVRENEPDLWRRVRSVLLPKDYIRLRLSGDRASDVADSSGTLLFDVQNRRWSKEMLAAFDIDEALMSQVFESIEITGVVSANGAAATGLRPGTPIAAGAGDNAAGAVGMGIVQPGMASATIGTSGVIFVVTEQPAFDPKGRIHTLCHAVPGRWHNTGVTLSAGLSLQWFKNNLGNGRNYDELDAEAENAPAGSDGAIWLPYLMGERAPYLDPSARAAFVGLTASHTHAHLTRAVLEGVAFSLRDSIEIFRELGASIGTVRLGGGGARSRLWQQIQADVYQRPVDLIDVDEGAAFGAAILAAVGVGAWKTVEDACGGSIRVAKRIEPDKHSEKVLDRNYAAYRLLYNALRPVSEIIAKNEGGSLMTDDIFKPKPEHKFSFGLWTVGNRGADPFGTQVRPKMQPVDLVRLLAEVGAWGVNFHDNDLVPIDATPRERDKIVAEFRDACGENGIVVPMATVNLFYDPVFRDGAFTANDPQVRRYALQKTMRAMDLGAEFQAETFVLWGGREGVETDACRRPDEAIKRFREAMNYLCEYNIAQNYGYRFALEAKPNEPRADIYFPTTGSYLAFIETLDHKEMVGVNPEVAHEHMSGLNMMHAVAQAWEAGKLFHIDLNDQVPGRYDQDLRFGSAAPKSAFWLVKFLEDVGYQGPRHFDAHAYRTEDYDGVKDFARGCMRTYLILKDKAEQWNRNAEIREIISEFPDGNGSIGKFSADASTALLAAEFDRQKLGEKGLRYERLDQLTMDILFGVN